MCTRASLTVCVFACVAAQVKLNDDSMPLAYMAIAVEGAAWDNPDNIPLMLANTIIGNYDRSVTAPRPAQRPCRRRLTGDAITSY